MKRFLYPLVLVFLTSIVYLNSLHGEFVFDDPIVAQNLGTLSVHNFWQALDVHGVRNLLLVTYRLNYLWGGQNPLGYHTVNVAFHTINVLIVYLILKLLVTERITAFFGAAVFAVHTLLSGSVAYISGRSSVLCATFYFLAVYFILRALVVNEVNEDGVFWPHRWIITAAWTGLAVIAGVSAWQVKQETIALPVFLAFLLLWRNRWWRTALILGLISVVLVVALLPQIRVMYANTAINPELLHAGLDQALPFSSYFPTYITAVAAYIFPRILVPVELSIDPDIPTRYWTSTAFIVSVFFLGLIVVGAFQFFEPLFILGLAAIFVSPLSAYAFVPLADPIQEHRLYIPALGIAIIASWLIDWAWRNFRVRWALIVPVVAILATLTFQRNEVWATETLLWRDAAVKAPDKARPHFDLGEALQKRGDMTAAIIEYNRSLQINPELHAARSNLASIYMDRGSVAAHYNNPTAAAQWYDSAERLLLKVTHDSPDYPEATINLAVLYLRTNRSYVAQEVLTAMVLRYPDNFAVHYNLGAALELLNQPREALYEYRVAADLRPDVAVFSQTRDALNRKLNPR